MAESSDRKELIVKIQQLPEMVEAAVKGLNDQQLNTPYREGGWTVRQVVHHLADSHMNAFIRMKLALTEENPTLKTYEQDDWARLPDTQVIPIQASLSILRGLHERWSHLLSTLPDSAWKRTANHPDDGQVSVEKLLNIYARHGANHVGQITTLRSTKGW
jgi:uncharacterized damage-inducible protein DinB